MLFKSLDQLATLIAAGEYALARDVVAVPLLGHPAQEPRGALALPPDGGRGGAAGRTSRSGSGHATPRIRIPEDVAALADFGPLRVFDEEGPDGVRRALPAGAAARHPDPQRHRRAPLARTTAADERRLRLDGLGSVPFDVPPGLYVIGLLYEPDPSRGA